MIVFALTSCDVIFLVSIGLVTGLGASVTVLGGGVVPSAVGEGTVDPATVQNVVILAASWIVGDSIRVTE